MKVYESPLFRRVGLPHLQHGFFTRSGGVSSGPYRSLNVSFMKEDPLENVKENCRRVAERFRLPATQLVIPREVHSNIVVPVAAPFEPNGPGTQIDARPQADGMITDRKQLLLGVISADCLPILIYYRDTEKPLVGAIHAGWKGAFTGIIQNGIRLLREEHGVSDMSRVFVAVGPAVRDSHFVIDSTVKSQVVAQDPENDKYFKTVPHRAGFFAFDLVSYAKDILLREGVHKENLDEIDIDTYTHADEFFSRKELLTRRKRTGETRFPVFSYNRKQTYLQNHCLMTSHFLV